MLVRNRNKAEAIKGKALQCLSKLEGLTSELQIMDCEETERFDNLPEARQDKELENDHETHIFAIQEAANKLEEIIEDLREALDELDLCFVEKEP